MTTRTLILTGTTQATNVTAVLSVTGESSLFCNLKTYNLKSQDLYCLAVLVGQVSYIAHNIDSQLRFDFVIDNANIQDDIKIALFDEEKKECKLSNNLNNEDIQTLSKLMDEFEQKNAVQSNLENSVHSTAKIDESVQKNDVESIQNDVNDTNIEDKEVASPSFLDSIALQLDEVFKQNSECTEIENLIPNSKWVNVDMDNPEGSTHYILGKIFDEENNVKYICYAVPTTNKNSQNIDIDLDYAQWLPTKPEDENSAGYYIMYQDANTGETIKFED